MFNSPLQKLISTISAPLSNTIGVLHSLKEQKSESDSNDTKNNADKQKDNEKESD